MRKRIIKVSKEIREYLVNKRGTIVSIRDNKDDLLFAVEIYRSLLMPGPRDPFVDVTYLEIEMNKIEDRLRAYEQEVKGRSLIVAKNKIRTREDYDRIRTELSKYAEKFGLGEIKFAINYDTLGIGNWSCKRRSTFVSRET